MYRATSLRHYLEETIKILFMPTFHGEFIMHNTVSIKIPDLVLILYYTSLHSTNMRPHFA